MTKMPEIKKKIKVNDMDKKILYELDLDCRTPHKKIAEKLGTYHNIVGNKIKRMERDGVIRGYSIIVNTRRIGYITYNTFLQFRKMSEQQEEELMEYLVKAPQVSFMVSLIGFYNLMVTIKAESLSKYHAFMQDFQGKFADFVQIDVSPHLITHFLPKKYLLEKIPSIIPVATSPDTDDPIEISPLQRMILQELKKDSHRSYTDIASTMRLDHRTIKEHIEKLVELQVIRKFLPLIKIRSMGYTWHICLVKLRKKTRESMEQFLAFVIHHPNLVFLAEGMGAWDLMIDIHCKDQEELAAILRDIRNQLDDFIVMLPLLVRDRMKHEFVMPETT